MRKFAVVTVLLVIYLFYPSARSHAQEIDVFVTVNMEQLPQEARVNVQTMDNDVKNYINNQRYTNIEWQGAKIPVEISIYLTGGSNNQYSARVFIVSKRTLEGEEGRASVALKFVDDKWSFEYTRFANLSYNPMRFQSFSTLLDFYMLLIIGYDMDTYGELEGSPVFEQAKQICQLGASAGADGYSTYSMPGQYTRYTLASEFTDLRYEDLRKLMNQYYTNGLDLMAKDKDAALKNIADVIAKIADYKKNKLSGPSTVLQAFFDSKYMELCALFQRWPDADLYKLLEYLDTGHTTSYEEAKAGKQ
jgi:hypothetical protein